MILPFRYDQLPFPLERFDRYLVFQLEIVADSDFRNVQCGEQTVVKPFSPVPRRLRCRSKATPGTMIRSISFSGTAMQSSVGSRMPKAPALSDSFPEYRSNWRSFPFIRGSNNFFSRYHFSTDRLFAPRQKWRGKVLCMKLAGRDPSLPAVPLS